jgi:GT2 family glycosyltransferase
VIAVVVLTHGRVHLLRQCVENVLARTTQTSEILLWDNASTDGTGAYLDALDDPRIHVVRHERNIGVNAYARAFAMTSAPHMIELDDDVVDAPHGWDATLLDAFGRLPDVGYLQANLVDDEHDEGSREIYETNRELYVEREVAGLRLLEGPTGGVCTITSRELYDRAGGFRENRRQAFWNEDGAYIEDIGRLGYRAAILADLEVRHAGGPYYSALAPEKLAFYARKRRAQARRAAAKRALVRVPGAAALLARRGGRQVA